MIYLSESYLDSSTGSDDENLESWGYNLIRFDHPSNNKRVGDWIYYKSILPLRISIVHHLQEFTKP